MSRRCTVRLKRIIRLFPVFLQIRLPVLCIVLRNPPVVVLRPAQHMIDDTARPHPVLLFACRIRHRQKSLHGMHIGIQAAVVVHNRKLRIPVVTGEPFFFIPVVPVIHLQRFLQEFFRLRPSRKISGSPCQDHKGMGITLLSGQMAAPGSQPLIPAVMLFVSQFSPQAFYRRIHQRFTALMSHKGRDTVHMRHTAGHIGLPVFLRPGRSVIPQIPGTSAG